MGSHVFVPAYGSASWKDPVASEAALPTSGNTEGDARVALSEGSISIWDGATWTAISGGGSSSAWGGLTGDIEDQLDLIALFNDKAPLTSPTFATSARFSYGTASRVPYWDSNKDLVASSVTPTELGYVSGVTSALQTQLAAKVTGGGTTVVNRFGVWNDTVGGSMVQSGGLGFSNAYGAADPAVTASNTVTFVLGGNDCFWVTSAGNVFMGRSSAANLYWNTNGGGDIGQIAGNRPKSIYANDGMFCKNNLTLEVVGKSLSLKTGTGAMAGNAILVAGTVTVTNTNIAAGSVIILSRKTAGGTIGDLTYTLSAGASFTITSASATDTSTVSYFIVQTA